MYRIEDCNEPHAHENPRNQRYGMYAQGAGCTHLCTLTLRIRTDQHRAGLSACGLTYTRAAVASRRAAPPRTLAERPRSKRLTPTRCARRHLAAAAWCSRSTARRSRCAGSCAWAAARAPARAQGADAGRAERWHQTASGRCVRAGEGAARRHDGRGWRPHLGLERQHWERDLGAAAHGVARGAAGQRRVLVRREARRGQRVLVQQLLLGLLQRLLEGLPAGVGKRCHAAGSGPRGGRAPRATGR